MSEREVVVFFLELAALLAVGLLAKVVTQRLGLQTIFGELIGGILLGPTLFGALAPDWFGWLFPTGGPITAARTGVIQLGMLFFLLMAGMELNYLQAHRLRAAIGWTSLCGLVLPFALGFGAAIALPGLWGSHPAGKSLVFALFLGTALAISALPVIARILMDMNLLRSEIGTVVMAAAMINDVIGWTLFAVILSNFVAGGATAANPWRSLLFVGVLWLVMLLLRPLAQRALRRQPEPAPGSGNLVGLAALAVLIFGALAESVGVHSFLGAFLVGIALSPNSAKANPGQEAVQQFVVHFFAPIYFVSVGLQANFVANFDLAMVVVIVLVACLGKVAGATLGARLGKLPARKALAVGFGMNARGAMEIVLASVALQYGLIDQRIFVALIIMAVVTSLISGPAMQRLLVARPIEAAGYSLPAKPV